MESISPTIEASGRPIQTARCSSSSAPATSWKSRPATSARSATWTSLPPQATATAGQAAFNNLGQLVFWASFTDGSQGVFVSNAVAHLPGDFNNDGTVDAADYVVWRKNWTVHASRLRRVACQLRHDSLDVRVPLARPMLSVERRCRPPFPSRPVSRSSLPLGLAFDHAGRRSRPNADPRTESHHESVQNMHTKSPSQSNDRLLHRNVAARRVTIALALAAAPRFSKARPSPREDQRLNSMRA